MKWFVVFLLLAVCISCSKSSQKEAAEEEDSIEVDAKYQTLVEDFGGALAQKDYRSAYGLLSTNLKSKLTYDQFVETMSPYLDSFSGEIEAGYSPAADPQDMAELVPEADRAKLVAEYTIEFSGTIEDEDDAVYFCTTWVIDDGGTPGVASFYLED